MELQGFLKLQLKVCDDCIKILNLISASTGWNPWKSASEDQFVRNIFSCWDVRVTNPGEEWLYEDASVLCES